MIVKCQNDLTVIEVYDIIGKMFMAMFMAHSMKSNVILFDFHTNLFDISDNLRLKVIAIFSINPNRNQRILDIET